MATIAEITGLPAMALYYVQKLKVMPPYAGETYFPATKIATDILSYLTKNQTAPKLAKASTYDASPVPINREGFEKEWFGTNFFRSTSVLNEADLEEINRAIYTNDDTLVKALIVQLFDDKTGQLLGMRTRREWMAMQAIMTGKVALQSNGVTRMVEYAKDPDFQGTAKIDWSDHDNSDPYTDIYKAIKTMKAKGIVPNQILMNDDTFQDLRNNERIKQTILPVGFDFSKIIISEDKVVDFIRSEFHVTPVVYDQGFEDEEATGTTGFTPFVTGDSVVLMNAPIPAEFAKTGSSSATMPTTQGIGHMAFAPTPEELGVRNGRIAANTIQIFDTGVAYHEYFNDKLVQTQDLVSMNCLPALEGSRAIFRLAVKTATNDGKAADDPTNVTATPTDDGANVTADPAKN